MAATISTHLKWLWPKFRAFYSISIVSAIIFIMLSYVIYQVNRSYGFGINQSASETPGLYWHAPLPKQVKMGDFIAFNPPKINWVYKRHYILPGEKVIKNVGAVPGEYLFTQDRVIYACQKNQLTHACRDLGRCVKKDPQGRSITCQDWQGYKIPKNEYYMQSQRVKISLDSRYLGLVNYAKMLNKVRLIWGW